MAVIVRIVSADGKKVITKTLPAVPAHLKVPEGAKVEVVDKETGVKTPLAVYVNMHANERTGDEGSEGAPQVTLETVQDWSVAEAWLDSMGELGDPETSSSEWFAPEAQEKDGQIFGFDKNTLWIGGALGAGAVGAAVAASGGSSGPKDDTPPGAPRTLDLAAADDNGASATDNITTNTSGLTIGGLAEAGAEVELFDGTTSLGKVTADAEGIFTKDVSLSEGAHTITAKATDKAGNVSTESTALTITVDTTTPGAPTALDLAAADDLGSSNSDNITSRTSALTITGTAEAGTTVELFDGETSLGTATVGANGTFTRDVNLAAGTHTITAKVTDAAGHVSAASEVLTITVESTPPTAPSALDLVAADDTGVSNSDNNTSKTSELTITGTAEAGSTLELFDGSTSLGTVTVAADGTFSKDITLTQGAHAITAKVTDLAGNVGEASAALNITVDTTAPAAPAALDLAADDDTGSSNGDNITSKTSGLTISGTAEAGTSIELFDGATSLGTVTVSSNGTFSREIGLAAGTHAITARATDAAGNVGEMSAALNVTVDTTSPSAPSSLDLAAADDDGSSNSDDVTSKTSGLTITGITEAGSVVELFDGTTSLGTAVTDASGSFTKDISLAVGTHSISAKATDAAGNFQSSSATLELSIVASALSESLLSEGASDLDHSLLLDDHTALDAAAGSFNTFG